VSLYQIRYSGRGPVPTASALAAIRDKWLRTGETPRGVTITPIAWNGKAQDLRAAIARIKNPHIGRAGVVKCNADPFWTYCDYDTKEAPGLGRFWSFTKITGLKPRVIRYDRTRRGWHVLIAWSKALTPTEQVAIQAALGSDYRRETYNLARIFGGRSKNPRFNLLFERKLK
jgi:hypothetical protein